MQEQAGLGQRKEHRAPTYSQNKIGRVTSTADYAKYGRINVMFLDYGQPAPVWVIGDLDREPVTGDSVIVGWLDGRKDAPYLQGFVKNEAYTTNFISVAKDKVRVQLPVYDIGTKGGVSAQDVDGNLLDEGNLPKRAYVELTPDGVTVSFPTSKTGSTPPATITLTATDVTIEHPLKVNITSPKDISITSTGGNVSLSAPSGNVTASGSTKSDAW